MTTNIPNNFFKNNYKENFVKKYFYKLYYNLICQIKKKIKFKKKKILDVGCSDGRNFKYLTKYNKVYGFDVNTSCLKIAKKNGYFVSNQSINNFNYKDNFFDIILVFGMDGYALSDKKFIKKIYSILNKNGKVYYLAASLGGIRLISYTLNRILNLQKKKLNFKSYNKLKEMFLENNFKIIKSYSIYHVPFQFCNKLQLTNSINKNLSSYSFFILKKNK